MSVAQSPIVAPILEYQRSRALRLFPELRDSPTADYVALCHYADQSPDRFLNLEAKDEALSLLRAEAADPSGLLADFLSQYRARLDISFRALAAINSLGSHDEPWPGFDYLEQLELIDREINPAYLNLSEAVLSTFLLPFAMRERRLRAKPTTDLSFYDCVVEARRTQLGNHLNCFDQVVRNAIAHGSVTYGQFDITYTDAHESRTLSPREVALQFDSLLDACNGIAAAFRCFYLLESTFIHGNGIAPPIQMLLAEVRAQTASPSWGIEGALELDIPGIGRQLNLIVRNRFLDDAKAYFYCLITAASAERFLRGFDRYFLSIRGRGRGGSGGWAVFEGRSLESVRTTSSGEIGSIASAVIDPGMIIFPPFLNRWLNVPRILRPIGTVWEAFRANWSVTKAKRWELDGVRAKLRHLKMYRKSYYAAAEAFVVLDVDSKSEAIALIRSHARMLFRIASLSARLRFCLRSPAVLLPLGYCTLQVYLSDFRVRRLEEYGLKEKLLCRITLKRLGRVREVPLAFSIPERLGSLRIDWNSNAVSTSELGL